MSTPGHELRFTRVVEAPRQLVFECMIDPDHLTHFWGPAGTERAARAHQGRRPSGRRVLHRHGQRPRRQPLPDPGRLRRGATTGASVVDRVALGHEGDDAIRGPGPGPHRGADPPALRPRGLSGAGSAGRVLDLTGPPGRPPRSGRAPDRPDPNPNARGERRRTAHAIRRLDERARRATPGRHRR